MFVPLWHEAFTPRRAVLLADIWGRGLDFGFANRRFVGQWASQSHEPWMRSPGQEGHESCSSLPSEAFPGPTSAPERGKGKGDAFPITLLISQASWALSW